MFSFLFSIWGFPGDWILKHQYGIWWIWQISWLYLCLLFYSKSYLLLVDHIVNTEDWIFNLVLQVSDHFYSTIYYNRLKLQLLLREFQIKSQFSRDKIFLMYVCICSPVLHVLSKYKSEVSETSWLAGFYIWAHRDAFLGVLGQFLWAFASLSPGLSLV